ncbi:MAG: type II toxin-antitoxin system PemK/MazF family toxin [Deltaproteobacteria bacterium]|nr:type II toxin-antitoxin system PemK/MazF family toxin [Deltaproteobacteria bacterium]
MVSPRRGDIFWVNLDPTVGTEIRKKRPAIVVSNDAANRRYHQVTVVPITSQRIETVEPFQVPLSSEESGLTKDSKALAEQIRTVSKLRLGLRAGRLYSETLDKLNTAIKLHLDLE